MADALRNEVKITLVGKERTMRATYGAMRMIESDLKLNWSRFAQKMAAGDIGIHEMARLIFHGLKGYGDTRSLVDDSANGLTVDQVGDAILEAGMDAVAASVVAFIQIGFHGTKAPGKPTEEAKAS